MLTHDIFNNKKRKQLNTSTNDQDIFLEKGSKVAIYVEHCSQRPS